MIYSFQTWSVNFSQQKLNAIILFPITFESSRCDQAEIYNPQKHKKLVKYNLGGEEGDSMRYIYREKY